MIPKQRETPAFKAYNLGGIAANLLVTGLSLLLLLCGSFYATLLAVALVGIGVKKSLINLIPHAAKSGPNDGYVVKLLSGKPAVQRDYAVYLALYEKLFLGEPILPQDYQYLREEASDERELLYYNEIRDILRSVEAETV